MLVHIVRVGLHTQDFFDINKEPNAKHVTYRIKVHYVSASAKGMEDASFISRNPMVSEQIPSRPTCQLVTPNAGDCFLGIDPGPESFRLEIIVIYPKLPNAALKNRDKKSAKSWSPRFNDGHNSLYRPGA